MIKFSNEKIKVRGVTLIELLVAVAVFGVFIGAVSGLLVSGMQSQGKVLATQELLDQTSYVLEYMTRALRMAQKQTPICAACIPQGLNYQIISSSEIRFLSYDCSCQRFFLGGGRLKIEKVSLGIPLTLEITSDKIKIESLIFNVSGETDSDNLQPRVTIFLIAKSKTTSLGSATISVQTSVSQRNVDSGT